MANPTVTLLGTVANDCDDGATDFGRNTNTEIFIQGTAAVGSKVSATTATFSTTTLTGAPYDFSSGGTEEGDHIIMWFDALNAANGFGIFVSEGTDDGRWNLPLPSGYTGGFVPLIVNPATDFDVVNGTWTTTGNPAQLNNVTGLGGFFDIAGSIMGNFDNALLDQMTIGTGLRIEDGDTAVPGTWEELQDFDEGTNQYGWLRLVNGAYVMQGKIRVGPASGNNDCKFLDADKVIVFLSAPVAQGFHEISVEEPGTGTTDFDQSGMFITAEDPSIARWSITVIDNASFDEANSVYRGFDVITLNSTSTLDTVTLLDGVNIIQNSATITSCSSRDAAVADGYAFIESDDLGLITSCEFTFNDDGYGEHAIEITVAGEYSFTDNIFNNYWSHGGDAGLGAEFDTTDGVGVDSSTEVITTNATHGLSTGDTIYYADNNGSDNIGLTDGTAYYANVLSTTTFSVHTTREDAFTDTSRVNLNNTGTGETHTFYSTKAAILNTSGGLVTINVTGGSTPYVRNDGYGSTAEVNVSVPLEINGVTEGTRGVMIATDDASELLGGYANASGIVSGSYSGATPRSVVVKARNSGIINAAIQEDSGTGFTDFSIDARDKTGTNDVDLLPPSPAVNDAFYFGGLVTFEEILINVTTAGSTYVLTWEYWDGGTWQPLTVVDGTNSFQTSGWNNVAFTAPSNWMTTTINSQGPFFYVRARVTTGGGAQPQAEEITLNKTTKYLPFEVNGTIQSGTGLAVTAVWIEDTNTDI